MSVRDRRMEARLLADGGILLAGGSKGYDAMSDSQGNLTYVNNDNDALQSGFAGNVNATNAVTATINSTTGVLTFFNWPTSDTVYQSAGGPKIRYVAPSAPTTASVAGLIASGQHAYVYIFLAPATAMGGTMTTSFNVNTNRATAALAAADQVLIAYGTSGVMVWDGIATFDGTHYSLEAGTPAAGSIVPAATGRDRRPWAKGAFVRKSVSAEAATATFTGNWVAIDSTNLAARVECTGVPLQITASGPWKTNNASAFGLIGIMVDGAAAADNFDFPQTSVVLQTGGVIVYTPAAGSHLIALAWKMGGNTGGTWSFDAGAYTIFTIEEIIQGQAFNGAA